MVGGVPGRCHGSGAFLSLRGSEDLDSQIRDTKNEHLRGDVVQFQTSVIIIRRWVNASRRKRVRNDGLQT